MPAYLPGHPDPVLSNDGLSSLTVENGNHDAGVRLELLRGDIEGSDNGADLLHASEGHLYLNRISPGIYRVRYQNLTTDTEFTTSAFKLAQTIGSDL
jgi:hypothetical protein